MTYLIFESELLMEEGRIKTWAPKRNPKTNSTKYWWENVSRIRKEDILYFISDTYLYAKGRALFDAKDVMHQDYYTEHHNNESWSDDGYGVISEVLEFYQDKKIKVVEEMKKRNYQIDKNEQHHFPFCIRAGNFSANQGGYCFEIQDKLVAFIEECVKSGSFKIKCADQYNHRNILDGKTPVAYGTSKIGLEKIKKGAKGEKGVLRFFKNKGFSVENVADVAKEPADLIIGNKKKQYKIEVKNITVETAEKSIYLSDSQLQNLYLQNTYLCLYYGMENEIILLLNPQKQKGVIKEIIDTFDTIRKNVNDQYNGQFYVDDISILVTENMITNNFIDISNCDLTQIESYLNEKIEV